jgi:regulator of protease activity HflC (stomatin/prohibitin superfamily)
MTAATIALLLVISGCGWAAPDAGQEAVLIQKPWFFGHGGVDSEPIKTGRTLIAVTTDVIYVDLRPHQWTVHFDDFMSHDGVPLDFDAVIRLRVLDAVQIIKQFGDNWYKTNVEAEFSNRVRQAVRRHGMNEMAIDTAAIEAVDREVTDGMLQYITSAKIPVELIQVTVGKANPPDSIKDQRIATATQQQRRITETERKLAEDNRRDAETSRAIADNAYLAKLNLSPTQFVQLELIKACGHSSGCTFLVGQNFFPTVQIK